jgi:hypothetical protein
MTAPSLKARIGVALPYVAFAALALGMINFVWIMSETLPLNLIPSDGQVVGGQYFMWSKTHGGYVEVSRSFWEWVRFHDKTFFLTWPLVMLAGGYLVFTQLSSKAGGVLSPILTSERVRQVRGSGPLLASTPSAGLIGRVWLSRPLLRVQVYPAGIVVKPLFMRERAMLAAEIGGVTPKGGLSAASVSDKHLILGFGVSQVSATYQPRGPFVEIEHSGAGMASPLVISGSGNWDIAQAISKVAGAARATSAASVLVTAQETAQRSSMIETKAIAQGGPQGAKPQHLAAPTEMGLAIVGFIVSGWLVWSGITWAIPQLGLPGVVWTAVVLFITAWNARRLFTRWRD